MKAILITQPGGPEAMHYDETPDPVPGDGELLVRVHATALNRADVMQRMGGYAPPPGASPILGLELAGEVVQAVAPWQIGERVMAVVTGGSYAELAVVPAGMAMRIPDTLTYEQAAAIPEAFLTAYLNMFTLGKLESGQSVLIHAGASGVGTAAIQLARAAGARVMVTAGSADKLAFCQELGAEVLINYKQESFVDRVMAATDKRGVNVILDFVGAAYWNENLQSLALDGRLMLIGMMGGSSEQLDISAIMGKRLTVTGTTLRRTPLPQKIELTRQFADFALPRFERGELKPIVNAVYSIRDAADAHRLMESNQNTGKIMLRVD